jgi:hypothetical protein
MYMMFLNWRFCTRLEHYNSMKGPVGGGKNFFCSGQLCLILDPQCTTTHKPGDRLCTGLRMSTFPSAHFPPFSNGPFIRIVLLLAM